MTVYYKDGVGMVRYERGTTVESEDHLITDYRICGGPDWCGKNQEITSMTRKHGFGVIFVYTAKE